MINIFYEENKWQVWLDTEVSYRDGICLGSAEKLEHALKQASAEITVAGAVSASTNWLRLSVKGEIPF
jgi:hypothetical protein